MPPKGDAKGGETQKEAIGFFTLPNGDMYEGGFLANKKKESVVRQGKSHAHKHNQ